MRTALLILFSIVSASAQNDTNLTVRMQVEIVAANALAASEFDAATRASIRLSDRLDPDNKASESEVRMDEGKIRVMATYILADYSRATNIAAQLTAVPNPALSGRIHIHFCPLEGSIKDWAGCDADRRAKVREIRL